MEPVKRSEIEIVAAGTAYMQMQQVLSDLERGVKRDADHLPAGDPQLAVQYAVMNYHFDYLKKLKEILDTAQ